MNAKYVGNHNSDYPTFDDLEYGETFVWKNHRDYSVRIKVGGNTFIDLGNNCVKVTSGENTGSISPVIRVAPRCGTVEFVDA